MAVSRMLYIVYCSSPRMYNPFTVLYYIYVYDYMQSS